MIGKTLGHYQITNQLGKGGMGEVFQAKDRKLGREVAIKKVKEQHSERFKQEARTVGRKSLEENLFYKGLLFRLAVFLKRAQWAGGLLRTTGKSVLCPHSAQLKACIQLLIREGRLLHMNQTCSLNDSNQSILGS